MSDVTDSKGEAPMSDVADSKGEEPMFDTTDSKGEPPSGDATDSKFFAGGPGGAGSDLGNTGAGEEDMFVYNMNHKKRGLFVIINNRSFDKATGMNDRTGTDVDAANLYQKFKALGFDAHIFNNLSCSKMVDTMRAAAKEDHYNSDCFGCAILSHGDEGVVYGTDGILKLDTLVEFFKGPKCPGLVGKPKLFFIQACRGSQLDHGVDVADAITDDGETTRRIPAEADFLFAYSTTPGYFSWRNSSKGSWFVQALTQVLQDYGGKAEIMWVLTRVNRLVAYEFESNASKEFMNKKKQVPSIVSQLTKQVFFPPKV